MYTFEGTVLIQKSLNFVRMLNLMKSRSGSKGGHVGLKPRLLGKIIEKKPCVHSRGYSLHLKFTKLCQNVNPYNI